MANLGKVTIDKAGAVKKSKFVYDHDNNTSFNFGEVQPILFHRSQTGNETHTFNLTSVIRMTDLACSTFGRADLKYSCHFVPYDDVFPNWDKVLSSVPDSFFDSRAPFGEVPNSFPTITVQTLSFLLCSKDFACIQAYTRSASSTSMEYSPYNQEVYSYDLLSYMFVGASNNPDYSFLPNTDFRSYYYLTGKYLSPEASDFVFRCNNGSTTDFVVCVKLNSRGRRLWKVITGLGYVFDPNDFTPVDFGALLAYYYAYYMAYSLPRYQNWYETSAYQIIKYVQTYGSFALTLLMGSTNPRPSDLIDLVKDFFHDLAETWYSENADYVSCAYSPTDNNPSVGDLTLDQLQYVRAGGNAFASSMFDQLSSGSTQPAQNGLAVSNSLDQVTDDILKKLYIGINKDSAIGYDIKKRLLAKGYRSFVDSADTHFIFSRTIPIKISDVDANSDTYNPADGTGKPLGSYTGKGVSSDHSGNISFTTSQPGYFICLACVVPRSKVVNGLNPAHLANNRYTHYNPDFDSVGFEHISKQMVGKFRNCWYSSNTGGRAAAESNTISFGLQPRYTGFKTSTCNILNGMFSLKSERNQWLPYTLDKVIVENNGAYGSSFDPSTGHFTWVEADTSETIPTAGETWRYPCDRSWKGNFDRIFLLTASEDVFWDNDELVDPDPVSDHFLCDIEIIHEAYSFMLPTDESWQTIDNDDPKPQMDINN